MWKYEAMIITIEKIYAYIYAFKKKKNLLDSNKRSACNSSKGESAYATPQLQ